MCVVEVVEEVPEVSRRTVCVCVCVCVCVLVFVRLFPPLEASRETLREEVGVWVGVCGCVGSRMVWRSWSMSFRCFLRKVT